MKKFFFLAMLFSLSLSIVDLVAKPRDFIQCWNGSIVIWRYGSDGAYHSETTTTACHFKGTKWIKFVKAGVPEGTRTMSVSEFEKYRVSNNMQEIDPETNMANCFEEPTKRNTKVEVIEKATTIDKASTIQRK